MADERVEGGAGDVGDPAIRLGPAARMSLASYGMRRARRYIEGGARLLRIAADTGDLGRREVIRRRALRLLDRGGDRARGAGALMLGALGRDDSPAGA